MNRVPGYALLFLLLFSCQKELSKESGSVVLTVDRTDLSFLHTKGSIDSFAIHSNTSWTIAIEPSTNDWLTISKSTGADNDIIYVSTIKDNLSDTVHNAVIRISPVNAPSIPARIINVTQQGSVVTIDTAKNVYGGTDAELFNAATPAAGGGFIAIGDANSKNGDVTGVRGEEDIWVVKVDAEQKIVWEKTFGGSDRDFGANIIPADGGGYIFTATILSSDGDITGKHGGGNSDIWLVKINESGTIIWKKTIGGSGNDDPSSIIRTSDGGYILSGSTSSSDGDITGNHGGTDGWIIKFDAAGNLLWQKTLGGTGFDAMYSVIQTADGGYISAGGTQSNDGDVTGFLGGDDAWLIKLDVGGNIQWQKVYGGTGGEWASSIVTGHDGGYVIAGNSSSNDGDVIGNHGRSDAWILKIDNTGNKLWQKVFGGSQDDSFNFISKSSDNGYILAGELRSPDIDISNFKGGDGDAWVIKIDISGGHVAGKLLGGTDEEWGNQVFELGNNKYLLIGTTFSTDKDIRGAHGFAEGWLMKFNM